MVFNFRNLFLSDSQKQVEAEVRNIGLAHTIRDVITGTASITTQRVLAFFFSAVF